LYGGFWRDKADGPKAMDCRIISARTQRYVANEQRLRVANRRKVASGFEFAPENRLFGLKETA
jgi:hypothetical protein